MKSIVVYATDENYVKLTAISLYSLLSHNPGTDITILASSISKDSATLLTGSAAGFGSSLRIIDVSISATKFNTLPGKHCLPPYSLGHAGQCTHISSAPATECRYIYPRMI